MLNQQVIDIIKYTVPALEVHGTEITQRFYQSMLRAIRYSVHSRPLFVSRLSLRRRAGFFAWFKFIRLQLAS